VLREKLFIFRL